MSIKTACCAAQGGEPDTSPIPQAKYRKFPIHSPGDWLLMIAFFDSLMPVKEEKPPPPQQSPKDKQVDNDRGNDEQFSDPLQVY